MDAQSLHSVVLASAKARGIVIADAALPGVLKGAAWLKDCVAHLKQASASK